MKKIMANVANAYGGTNILNLQNITKQMNISATLKHL